MYLHQTNTSAGGCCRLGDWWIQLFFLDMCYLSNIMWQKKYLKEWAKMAGQITVKEGVLYLRILYLTVLFDLVICCGEFAGEHHQSSLSEPFRACWWRSDAWMTMIVPPPPPPPPPPPQRARKNEQQRAKKRRRAPAATTRRRRTEAGKNKSWSY